MKLVETKMVSLDNGNYRAFILLKYPVAKAYKSYIEKIEKSPELKSTLTEIKNTDVYKIKKAVAQYSDSKKVNFINSVIKLDRDRLQEMDSAVYLIQKLSEIRFDPCKLIILR